MHDKGSNVFLAHKTRLWTLKSSFNHDKYYLSSNIFNVTLCFDKGNGGHLR